MKSHDQISTGTVNGIALCQRFFLAANKGPVAYTELPRRTLMASESVARAIDSDSEPIRARGIVVK